MVGQKKRGGAVRQAIPIKVPLTLLPMRKMLVLLSRSVSKKLPLVFVKHMTIPTINPSEMITCVKGEVSLGLPTRAFSLYS